VKEHSQGPRCVTGVSHLNKAEERLETYGKTTPSAGKVTASEFRDSQCVLFVFFFLTEQRIINAAYYMKSLKDRLKPALCSKRRGRSVKSVCLHRDNARPHTAALTTVTWGLPHSAYSRGLAPSDFYLVGPLKEALGGKTFRADNEVKLSMQ